MFKLSHIWLRAGVFAFFTGVSLVGASTGPGSTSPGSTNSGPTNPSSSPKIAWQAFEPAAFERAEREGKFVLLDLVAVWCHWCHVMEAKTYTDPAVIALINKHFVPVKADHDERPDLAERYREYGWPATVVLDANGNDILKRAGYIDKAGMHNMLTAVWRDPTPERDSGRHTVTEFAESPLLDANLRRELKNRHVESYDEGVGSLDMGQKFLDIDSLRWSMRLIRSGDASEQARESARLRETLDANLALIDPHFGGVYQYSTHGDWQHPHYEKIMRSQWANLIAYSQACTLLDEPRYCAAAEQVAAYLIEFWRDPNAGFYSSQDADLNQGSKAHDYFASDRETRLKQGLPRIDKAQYAANNGMAIEGLTALYEATGKQRYLETAKQAAQWAYEQRRLYGGGYRHAQVDAAGPYLADTLFMGRAYLALHRATGEDVWLKRSLKAASFIQDYTLYPKAGLAASADNGTPVLPRPQIDQNIQAATWLLDLAAVSGESQPRELAEHTLRYLATPEIALSRITEAGILEADARLNRQ